MREALLILVLILSACGGGGESKPEPVVVEPPPPSPVAWELMDYPFNKRTNGYGVIEELNYNSWRFKSHTIVHEECESEEYWHKHYCKKVDVWIDDHGGYDSSHTPGREMKIVFDFTLEKWNYDDPPYHIIIGQDWFKHDETDPTNSHPFTTWKLKPWKGVSMSQFNNAWQWDYTYLEPYDLEDPEDLQHRHPEDPHNGDFTIEVGQTYLVEWIIKDGKTLDGGEVITIIDGVEVSHAYYQTKPIAPVTGSAISWGAYWYRDYNPRSNACAELTGKHERECKSIHLRIENLEIYTRIN